MLKKVHDATICAKQDSPIYCRSANNAPIYHFLRKTYTGMKERG